MRELSALPTMLQKLFADIAAAKWTVAALMGCAQYFFPTDQLKNVATTLSVFIMLDTITGIVAASVTGKAISSAKLGRVLVKCLGYAAVIVVVGMAAKNTLGFGKTTDSVLVAVIGAMMMTEGVSVLENVKNMGVWVPPFVAKMLQERLAAFDKNADVDEPNTHPAKPAGD